VKAYLLDLKTVSILIVIAIIAISYGLFFYFQSITENDIKSSLFMQQELRQEANTRALANHIESDLSLLMANLRILATSPGFQGADGSNLAQDRALMRGVLDEMNTDSQGNRAPVMQRLFFIDKNGLILADVHESGVDGNFEGSDASSMQYFQEVRSTLKPTFSKGYVGLDGNLKIAVSYPILDENGGFLGVISAMALSSTFFQHYGNIYDIESQYLSVLDIDSAHLVHPVQSLVGKPFFGEFAQDTIGRVEALNNLVAGVMQGQPGQAVYEFRGAERLTTGHPVYLEGQPTYFVFVITPTAVVYANVDDALSSQRIETFSLLAGTTATIFVLIIFLAMWNSNLRDAVKAKTEQLVESNKQLSMANEQLSENYEKLHASEKMQKEFINIAAHELRTPVQPIIGLSDVLLDQQQSFDPETRDLLQAIHRNAMRLHRLTSDILDVTRIESGSMQLRKKRVDVTEILKLAVKTAETLIADGGRIKLVLTAPQAENLRVFADGERIHQVLLNLLSNAIKFTEKGTITVASEKRGNEVVIKVTDSGRGIDPEIMPRLFTKFATKSDHGTGLGLYISKSIIEAHGGRIWAENNPDGKGATFAFSLPAIMAAPIEAGGREPN
jgi:signal transduction histidine kinase